MRHDGVAGRAILLAAFALAIGACHPGSQEGDTNTGGRVPGGRMTAVASVEGHYKEINTGDFDLVDGIAYTTNGGTVVYVTEKAIASPVLGRSTCPMTQARAIALLRNAAYAEVTIDGAGRSKYFAAGVQYGGQGREEDASGWLGAILGSRPWKIRGGRILDGRIAGRVIHSRAGGFAFDLPVFTPAVNEVNMGDRVHGLRVDSTRRAPTEEEVTAAYVELRRAVRAKDLEALLSAQGFDATQVSAIRDLPGIEADFVSLTDRFLVPGDPEETAAQAGYGQVGGRGKNAKGKPFINYYEFAPCGDSLVLVSIGENPQ